MKLKLNPTKQLVLLLSVMSAVAVGLNFSSYILLHLAGTLGFGLVLYWFYSLVTSKKKDVWNVVITSLIIFLILHYGTGLTDVLYPMSATFIAITMKFFIEFKRSPIINPAVAGLLLTATIATLLPNVNEAFISWWGASFKGWLSLLIIAPWVIFGVHKWRKMPTLISFLVVHMLLLVFRGEGIDFVKYTFTDSTIYFFAAIMLIEPKTSPIRSQDQVYYGIVAALLYNILAGYSAPLFELFAIAGANLTALVLKPKRKENPVKVDEGVEE